MCSLQGLGQGVGEGNTGVQNSRSRQEKNRTRESAPGGTSLRIRQTEKSHLGGWSAGRVRQRTSVEKEAGGGGSGPAHERGAVLQGWWPETVSGKEKRLSLLRTKREGSTRNRD